MIRNARPDVLLDIGAGVLLGIHSGTIRLFLFGVFGERNGVFLEDMDEDIIKELLHDDVRMTEGRAGIGRRREMIRELLDFLDDITGTAVFRLEFLDESQRLGIRMRMLAHQREHQLLLFGKMFLQLSLETGVEMMETREHLAMMRIMDDEDLVEELFRLRHELAIRDVMRSFKVVEHLRDLEILEGFDIIMHIPLLRLPGCHLVELRKEFFHIEPFSRTAMEIASCPPQQ